MRRIAILLAVVAMVASTATISFADDDAARSSEPREFNEAKVQKLDALAGFLLAEPSAAGGSDEEQGDLEGDEAEAAEEAAMKAAEDQIIALRYGDSSTGWGAIFKLIQLAKAQGGGATLQSVLEEIAEEGWGFGWRFKAVDNPDDPTADGPKNFAQLKKQNREAKANHGKKPDKP